MVEGRTGPKAARKALVVASIALATDGLIYGMAVPVLPLLAADRGASTAAVGALFAAYAIALVVATPLARLWLDRAGARRPMLVGLFGLAAATVLFAAVERPGLLLLARAFQGAAAGVTWTASLALIAATHTPEERGKAMGLALSAVGTGVLAGPPLGGLLADWLGVHAPFVLAAVLAAGDGVARWTLVPDHGPAAVERPSPRPLGGGRELTQVAAFTALGAALIAFVEPVLPLHLRRSLDAGSSTIGLLFGAAALAATLAPPLAGLALGRFRATTLAAAGAIAAAVALASLAAADSLWLVALALIVLGAGAAFLLTPTVTLMADIAERQRPPAYGAVYALYNLAYAVGLAAAPLLAGLAAQALGFDGAALAAAAAVALAALVLGAARPSKRAPRTEPT